MKCERNKEKQRNGKEENGKMPPDAAITMAEGRNDGNKSGGNYGA
jgi:hypothetical protein